MYAASVAQVTQSKFRRLPAHGRFYSTQNQTKNISVALPSTQSKFEANWSRVPELWSNKTNKQTHRDYNFICIDIVLDYEY